MDNHRQLARRSAPLLGSGREALNFFQLRLVSPGCCGCAATIELPVCAAAPPVTAAADCARA